VLGSNFGRVASWPNWGLWFSSVPANMLGW
jgi:hypothetical protein